MKTELRIENLGGRLVCIGGVGEMFHQEGFPLGISARQLKNNGIELSWFHVIKELYFQYTSNDRLFAKIQSEIEDASSDGIHVDINEIKRFVYADYETQCEMIFKYLWGCDSSEAIKSKEVRDSIASQINFVSYSH